MMCTKCKKKKTHSKFYSDKRRPSGLQSQCKKCFIEQHKKYHKTSKYKEWEKTYYSKPSIKKHLRQKMSIWRKTKKGKEYLKAYRQRPKVKIKYNIYCREYRKRPIPRQKDILLLENYRAKKISTSDATVTYESTRRLLAKQKGRCKKCRILLNKTKRHLDHIIPISKGGKHTIRNVQWLCYVCNIRKSNKI